MLVVYTVFVEKILRVQPNVRKLYLLIRATDDNSALQRFNIEVVENDLFKVLKEKYGTNLQSVLSEKVTPVAGDITHQNLGIKDSNLVEEMWKDVDVVVNVAATTNFDERYDIALTSNTLGVKNVLNFAAKCVKIQLLLHVSTAYVSGEKPGLILETPYRLGDAFNSVNGLEINTEEKVIEEKLKELNNDKTATDKSIKLAMKKLGIERANKFGWPNTYVFTKALGEMVLGHLKGDMPLVIIRPTIITSTYKEPFPGWIQGLRTIDSLIAGYGKGKMTCLVGDSESIIDVIPGDMVVNAMIAAMAAHANQPYETIYHVGSSVPNPLKYKEIQNAAYNYFCEHPLVNKGGMPVIVPEAKGLQVVNWALCHTLDGTYKNLKRKINYVLRMVELYKPYLFSKSLSEIKMTLIYDADAEADEEMLTVMKAENVQFPLPANESREQSPETSGNQYTLNQPVMFWTNGDLLGLEPSKSPDFGLPTGPIEEETKTDNPQKTTSNEDTLLNTSKSEDSINSSRIFEFSNRLLVNGFRRQISLVGNETLAKSVKSDVPETTTTTPTQKRYPKVTGIPFREQFRNGSPYISPSSPPLDPGATGEMGSEQHGIAMGKKEVATSRVFWSYDDNNTEKLRQVLGSNEVEANIFYFDPKVIDWDDYLLHIHIPGAVKHVFK
ncbi:hypothetical protein LXL04_013150 [Taraxacum kok-saghyz]